jgi:hypothetical protein
MKQSDRIQQAEALRNERARRTFAYVERLNEKQRRHAKLCRFV